MRSSKYLVYFFCSSVAHGWWSSSKKDASPSRREFDSENDAFETFSSSSKETSTKEDKHVPGGFRFFEKSTDEERNETTRNRIGGRSASGSRVPSGTQHHDSWWRSALTVLPRIQCSVEPTTAIKVKKNLQVFSRNVWIGAEYHAQNNIWRLQTSSDDVGTIQFNGREIILYKSFAFSPLPDLLTRLRLRTTLDISERHATVHLGFGTDQMTAVTNGLAFRQQFPIDKNAKLEIQAKVVLPTPEIEFSTKTSQSNVRMSNIELSVNELNLLLEY